jgi:hypothetical protein
MGYIVTWGGSDVQAAHCQRCGSLMTLTQECISYDGRFFAAMRESVHTLCGRAAESRNGLLREECSCDVCARVTGGLVCTSTPDGLMVDAGPTTSGGRGLVCMPGRKLHPLPCLPSSSDRACLTTAPRFTEAKLNMVSVFEPGSVPGRCTRALCWPFQ